VIPRWEGHNDARPTRLLRPIPRSLNVSYVGPPSKIPTDGGPIPVDAGARFSNRSLAFAHDAVAGVGKMGVWLLSASWCGRRRDVRADMLCDPTGRCCGPFFALVVDTPLGGAIAVKSSTGLCFPSTAGW
jgi:hypothetical protein